MENKTAGASQGLALIFIAILPTMAIVSLVPNLPQLMVHFGGAPNAAFWVPMILTLPSLCIALFSPFVGSLTDKFGRRPVLLASLALFTIVGVLPQAVESLPAVLATRFFVGIAEAGILTSQSVLMGDYFTGPSRQRWLGWLSALSPVLAAMYVLAGGALGSFSWQAPFLLYLVGIPAFIWAYISIYEPAPVAAGQGVPSSGAGFPWRVAGVVALVTIAVSVLYFVQAVQLGRIFFEHGIDSPARISLFVTLASAGVVAGGLVFGRIAALPVSTRFCLMLFALGFGYVGLGFAPGAMSALGFALLAQFGNGLAVPLMIGWSLDKFGAEHRGRGMGIWGACFFAGTFLSPPMLSGVTALSGGFLHAVAGTGVIAIVLAVAVLLMRGSARFVAARQY